MTRPDPRLRFRIQDLLAIVVGYGLAALLFRAFWPSSGLSGALIAPALGLYLWLGLALSGPIILLRHEPRRDRPIEPGRSPAPESVARTRAEWAWLLIGIYWIVLGLVLIPSRRHGFRFGDALLYGLVPIGLAWVPRLFGPKAPTERPATSWTHLAALGLLASWPIAWACLIILGRHLP
jgi:hypothetical protein